VNQEESKEASLHFFNTIEERGLYEYNSEYYDTEFFVNFRDSMLAYRDSFAEVDTLEKFSIATKEQMEIFKIISFVNFINMNLEVVKKYLKVLIKNGNDGIEFDENTTLGQIIKKTCNKIDYSEELKNATFDLFCVDFRNAIAHQHYLISEKEIVIYPKDDVKKKTYEVQDLVSLSYQVSGLYNTITEFADKKAEEKFRKLVKLRKQLVELKAPTSEIEELDKDLEYFMKIYPDLDLKS